LLSLKNSRTRRLILFLLTAFPVLFVTVTPNLVMPSRFFLMMTVKCRVW